MNATQAYTRAKLLCVDPAIATVCEQLAALTTLLDAPSLPIHRVLAEKAPTLQSRDMHQALALTLHKVTDDESQQLTVAHVLCWAQITRHFVVAGVRQAAAQFAIETEELCKALAAQLEEEEKNRSSDAWEASTYE